MLEHEQKLKQEKGLGHDTLLFAKKVQGRGNGKGKGKGKDNKGNSKFDDKKNKQSGSNEMTCHHCQNKCHIIRKYPGKMRGEKAVPKPWSEKKEDSAAAAAAAVASM
ncbi:hypothetical protein K440DRAFT_638847 [Wilcoxina mikolae CBS 423.85]|nr:hypothetical protein K440DRAFT_638847 [Wilcoxina mikolae CBS 423.85]